LTDKTVKCDKFEVRVGNPVFVVQKPGLRLGICVGIDSRLIVNEDAEYRRIEEVSVLILASQKSGSDLMAPVFESGDGPVKFERHEVCGVALAPHA